MPFLPGCLALVSLNILANVAETGRIPKRTILLEKFYRVADALHALLLYLLYRSKEAISEIKKLNDILQRRNDKQGKLSSENSLKEIRF
jgi:hypothetical protein